MKDNKGFSLVEIVIILAIMAVLSGAIFYSFTLMTGQYSRECANNISTALDKEKNYALTRSASVDCYMEIVKVGNSYVARYYVPASAIADGTGDDWLFAEEFKIGKSRVNITCQIGGSEVAIADNKSVKFVYNRISGAMKAIVESEGVNDSLWNPKPESGVSKGSLPPDSDSSVHTLNGDEVIIASSYGRRYEIKVYTATGKHVLSRIN